MQELFDYIPNKYLWDFLNRKSQVYESEIYDVFRACDNGELRLNTMYTISCRNFQRIDKNNMKYSNLREMIIRCFVEFLVNSCNRSRRYLYKEDFVDRYLDILEADSKERQYVYDVLESANIKLLTYDKLGQLGSFQEVLDEFVIDSIIDDYCHLIQGQNNLGPFTVSKKDFDATFGHITDNDKKCLMRFIKEYSYEITISDDYAPVVTEPSLREYCIEAVIDHFTFKDPIDPSKLEVLLKEQYVDRILDLIGCNKTEKRLVYKCLRAQGVFVVSADFLHNKNDQHGDRFDKSSGLNTEQWETESFLKKHGYTVAQNIGLSSHERHEILTNIMENYRVPKSEICRHIIFMIKLRRGQSQYSAAISKWQDDLDFLNNLK